jgi:hypothetical protein
LVSGAKIAVGSAPEDFDWEAAQDAPLALSRLTSHAVAYELVSIVEHRLHELAGEPWLKKRGSLSAWEAGSQWQELE